MDSTKLLFKSKTKGKLLFSCVTACCTLKFCVTLPSQGLPAHVRCLVAINEHDEQKYFTSHELDFPFEVPDGSNGSLTAKVTGPDNNRVDELVTKDRVDSSTYHIRFIPRHPGRYRMDVFYSNIPVKDSPFYIMVRDQIQTPGAKQCEAKGRGLTGGKAQDLLIILISQNINKKILS